MDSKEIWRKLLSEIYKIYILTSIRFLLTVHDLPITYLKKLDTIADKYLKTWAGLPRCATTAVLHLNTALDIKNISTLYKECHAVTHASSRLLSDSRVNLVIDNKLKRESRLVRKQSITVCAEDAYISAMNYNCVQGEMPSSIPDSENDTPDSTPLQKFINDIKNDVRISILAEESHSIVNHVKTLVKQGHFLELT